MKQFMTTINTILIIAAILAVCFGASTYADRYLKMKAIDGCMAGSMYRYEDKLKGITTEEPMKDSYEKCMKAKGY
jgi:hypothetical protein